MAAKKRSWETRAKETKFPEREVKPTRLAKIRKK